MSRSMKLSLVSLLFALAGCTTNVEPAPPPDVEDETEEDANVRVDEDAVRPAAGDPRLFDF